MYSGNLRENNILQLVIPVHNQTTKNGGYLAQFLHKYFYFPESYFEI
jgi:hypothetical protein